MRSMAASGVVAELPGPEAGAAADGELSHGSPHCLRHRIAARGIRSLKAWMRRLASCLGGGVRGAPRAGSGRSYMLLEHACLDGQVLLAQTLVNGLLPFVSQAGKDG